MKQTSPVSAPIRPVLEIPPGTAPDVAAFSAGVSAAIGAEVSGAAHSSAQHPASQEPDAGSVNEPGGRERSEETALISAMTATTLEQEGLIPRQTVESLLPVQLNVGIPIRDFRVRNLISLTPGVLVESQWQPGEDVPVVSGDVQVAWSEFEVVDAQLAVRLTRLS